jgi:hypothetical protein
MLKLWNEKQDKVGLFFIKYLATIKNQLLLYYNYRVNNIKVQKK